MGLNLANAALFNDLDIEMERGRENERDYVLYAVGRSGRLGDGRVTHRQLLPTVVDSDPSAVTVITWVPTTFDAPEQDVHPSRRRFRVTDFYESGKLHARFS